MDCSRRSLFAVETHSVRLTPKFSCERFYYHSAKVSIIRALEERSTQRLAHARLLQLSLGSAGLVPGAAPSAPFEPRNNNTSEWSKEERQSGEMTAINTDVRRDGGDVTKVESYLRRPRRIRSGELIFLHLPNALVQLRAILLYS